MADILALGEALAEFMRLPDGPDRRPIYRQGFGGDTSNAIIAAARQGAKTGYISAVGGDPLGNDLMQLWAREGVCTDQVKIKPQDPTGAYFVNPHPSGRQFSYARRGSAASHLAPGDLDETRIQNAQILHVSAISLAVSSSMRHAAFKACRLAKDAGVKVSLDTNLRLNLWTLKQAREVIFDLLPLADIVFPSDDEAEQLVGSSDEDTILRTFAQHGAEFVLLKRGEKGPVMYTKGQKLAFQPPKIKAVDSTGAGDSFAGAWLAYYLETADPHLAVERAMRVAAHTVGGHGAVEPIPRRAEVLRAVKAT